MTDIQRAAIAFIERRDERDAARAKLRSLYDDGHCENVDDNGEGEPCYQKQPGYKRCAFCERHQVVYEEYRATCNMVAGALRSLKSAVKPYKGQLPLEFDARRKRGKA